MKYLLNALAVAVAIGILTGCQSSVRDTVRTEVRVNPQLGFEMISPKDVSISRAEYDPVTGKITLRDYQSASNAAAIAQAGAAEKARAETMQFMGQFMGQAIAAIAARPLSVPPVVPEPPTPEPEEDTE